MLVLNENAVKTAIYNDQLNMLLSFKSETQNFNNRALFGGAAAILLLFNI
jgi:hypothetical protein